MFPLCLIFSVGELSAINISEDKRAERIAHRHIRELGLGSAFRQARAPVSSRPRTPVLREHGQPHPLTARTRDGCSTLALAKAGAHVLLLA